MKCLCAIENRLVRNADEFRVQGPAGYSVWSELLEFFDEVLLVARVRQTRSTVAAERVNGPNVSVHGLPDFSGLGDYAVKFLQLRSHVREAVAECDAYVLQMPGVVGHLLWRELRKGQRPYAVNVMGDPWDALAPRAMKSCFRPVYRYVLTREMRNMCGNAQAVLYWSRALQQRYPPAQDGYASLSPRISLPCGFASADLIQERVNRGRTFAQSQQRCFKVGFIGTFEQLYKGPDTLLHAVLVCSRAGLGIQVFMAGEGCYLEKMKSLAQALRVQDKVVFLGQLGFGRPIVDFLDSLDLFVMPSRAEGLPRALVEAMARGCPCVGSNIGGIPELLQPEDMVPPGDAHALAAKILEVAADPKRLAQMSSRNLAKAKEFDPEVLRRERASFYRRVKMQAGSAIVSGTTIALGGDPSPLREK